jgi:hypothetical protein
MEKVIEIGLKYGAGVISVLLVIAGFFKLKAKAYSLGDKIGDKVEDATSESTRIKLAEFAEKFAEGLKGESYDGDQNLISNDQIDSAVDKAKIDLGLEE